VTAPARVTWGGVSPAGGIPSEDRFEWQIEWQTVLASASQGRADAGLGLRSGWSAA
jgi:hypothetical protein